MQRFAFMKTQNKLLRTVGMFLFGLHLPKISSIIGLLSAPFRGNSISGARLPWITLLCFCVSYYAFGIYYGLYHLNAFYYALLIFAYYHCGILEGGAKARLSSLFFPFCVGMAIYTALTLLHPSEIARLYFHPWPYSPTGVIPATILSLFVMIPVNFLPVLLLNETEIKKDRPLKLGMLGLALICIFLNFVMANRSWLASLIFLSGILLLKPSGVKKVFRRKMMAVLIVLMVAITLLQIPAIQNSTPVQTIASKGLNSVRFSYWKTGITNLWTNPMGGRTTDFRDGENSPHAHNFWLDVLNDSGVIPLFFILWFHILHLRPLFRFFRHTETNSTERGFAIAVAWSFFFGFAVEPTMLTSMPFLLAHFLFLGYVKGYFATLR